MLVRDRVWWKEQIRVEIMNLILTLSLSYPFCRRGVTVPMHKIVEKIK